MSNKNLIIKLVNVYKKFQLGTSFFHALNDINISFYRGEFSGFIGPSGSGKTTLLNIIGLLDFPSKGEAFVLDKLTNQVNNKESAKIRKNSIGFIFQNYSLLPIYTVYENIEFALLLQNITEKKRKNMVLEAIDAVGLNSKTNVKPSLLSGGECQRVSIARAIVKKPQIVLADEPSANLDAQNSHNILKIMKKLCKELNITFIFSTHDEKVMTYLDRKIYLEDGKIVNDIIINNN